MEHHLGVSTHLHVAGTELILVAGIAVLGFMGGELTLFSPARVVMNQGDTPGGLDVLTDDAAAIGTVHQFIAGSEALGADARQWPVQGLPCEAQDPYLS